METSKSKIPSGVTIDIEASPDQSKPSSFLGFSTSSPSVETTVSQSKSKDGFFKSNGKIDFFRIGLVIIILLFLGVNVFSYLGDFLQNIKDSHFIQNILKSLGYGITETTKDITEVTAEGAKLGVDVAAGTVESGIDVIQGQLDIDPNQSKSSPTKQNQQQQQQDPALNSALAHAEDNTEPQPDDASSSTQRLGPGKSGYCYIGEDRGFRSCIKVKEGDTCMSGEIFPSQQICVNPNLRE